ncbi:selenoprotein F [Cocos nucifera]|nr:selenoprotein F [Cocos nucifera]
MGQSAAVLSLLLFFLSGLTLALGERLSAGECENLGFTGLALCSDCSTFAEYVKDKVGQLKDVEHVGSDWQGLIRNFFFGLGICQHLVTFSGAILEVCMRKLVFYPEVVSFIDEEKDEFPYVKVQYAYGSPPKLIMLDNEGQQKETIRLFFRFFTRITTKLASQSTII